MEEKNRAQVEEKVHDQEEVKVAEDIADRFQNEDAVEGKDNPLLKVVVDGQITISVPAGTSLLDLLAMINHQHRYPVVAACIDNVLCSLHDKLERDCRVDFIDLSSDAGMRVYSHSLTFILVRAAAEIFPGSAVVIQHTLGNGVYGEIKSNRPLRDKDIARLERQMQYIIEANEPIVKVRVSKEKAAVIFREAGFPEKIHLLPFLPGEAVELYNSGWFYDFATLPLTPYTGYLQYFKLRFYLPGFILELPQRNNPTVIPPYVEHGKLANVIYESKKWADILGVRNVVQLNNLIQEGDVDEIINMVRVAEAFHEKKIMRIADQIAENIDRIRMVLIAGPSSSGKTTFVRRLAVQLQVNGIRPVAISLDDYFVDREKTPRDEEGNYDFEHIDAIDRELFNEHLAKLIQGEEVEMPHFNFTTGKREYLGYRLRLSARDLIIVEGIHCLNDVLTAYIPKSRKYKIYVSALTPLSLDDHNRIHTTDVRLIRRIIRDNETRGYTALETLRRWPLVRRGEEKYIFPYQETADVMFNSALPYELAVLKAAAEPLLKAIPSDVPEYAEAQRLLCLLSYFLPLSIDYVPYNSIVREFLGGSCFYTCSATGWGRKKHTGTGVAGTALTEAAATR